MAPKVKQTEQHNPALQLHDILDTLRAAATNPDNRQRAVLCDVLQVPGKNIGLLYARLTELYRLPLHVRRLLVSTGASPEFLEWADPVENAVRALDGSAHTNLIKFRDTPGLVRALHHLPLCGALLQGRDSLEVEQLHEINASIEATLETVGKADNIDPDFADWLQQVLLDVQSAVADAMAVGTYAARDRLHIAIGRARLGSPSTGADTEEEKKVLKTVIEIVHKVAAVVNAGANVARLLTD